MKDILGNEVFEGDTVVFAYKETQHRKMELLVGKVVRVMPKTIEAELLGGTKRVKVPQRMVCDLSVFMPAKDNS